MQVKKIAAGALLAGALGMGGMFGAAPAFAEDGAPAPTPTTQQRDNWTPGKGGWQPGAGIRTFSANVSIASNNLSSNKLFSGNTFNVLSNNRTNILNGSFSGNTNIINTGANSFNTTNIKVWKYDNSTRTWVKVSIKDSFNTTNTTTTNGGCTDVEDGNNGHGNDCDGDDGGNPGNS